MIENGEDINQLYEMGIG